MTKKHLSEVDLQAIEVLGGRGQFVSHALFGDKRLQSDPGVQRLIHDELAARQGDNIDPPSEDVANAIRQFVRILSRDAHPDSKINLLRSAEKFIKDGRFPNIRPHQLAVLFYPNDKELADNFSDAINVALSKGELPYMSDAGGPMLTRDCLIAWPDCPLVPLDSPLRFWLPDFMHATAEDATPAKTDAATETPGARPMLASQAQDEAILSMLRDKGYDPLAMPPYAPGKPGVKAEIRRAIGDRGMWTGETVFDKAWERLAKNGDIAYRK